MTSETLATEEVFISFWGRKRVRSAGRADAARAAACRRGQAGDVSICNLADPREHFGGFHTALYQAPHIAKGGQLISTWPGERPIMTMIRDSLGDRRSEGDPVYHDVLMDRCSQKYRERRYGEGAPGCQDRFAQAIEPHALTADRVHDAVNPFMATAVDSAEKILIDLTDAREGGFVELGAEIDCRVALAARPGGTQRQEHSASNARSPDDVQGPSTPSEMRVVQP